MSDDQTIICRDCKSEFIWTAGEQEFYAQKGLSVPTRCKACRTKRRAEREQRDSQPNTGPRQEFVIECAQCGKAGTVPFQPSRPDVLCRDCFVASKNQTK